ncbi:MAG: MAPEG family protein [Phyllobacterium sp.]
MSQTAIFWPMIALTALIYAVYFLVLVRRRHAVVSGQASARDFKLPLKEPEASVTAIRNLTNLYELPVLFYVVCLALYAVNGATFLAVLVAWLFVVARIAHTFVHVTSNRLRLRQPIFAIGYILTGVLWVMLALHLLLPPVA